MSRCPREVTKRTLSSTSLLVTHFGVRANHCVLMDRLTLTYIALSFVDNRVSLAILAYDQNRKLVGRFTKDGARYIMRIMIMAQGSQVNFIGQSGNLVSSTADELYNLTNMPDPLVPLITIADASAQPKAPDGLVYVTLNGSNGSYPVLRYSGLTYWGESALLMVQNVLIALFSLALSYVDNRVSFCILGYDASMNLVKRLPKDGARYLDRIVRDGSTIQFIGQSNRSVSFTLQELAP